MLDRDVGKSMISIYNINNGIKEPTPPVSTLCYKSNTDTWWVQQELPLQAIGYTSLNNPEKSRPAGQRMPCSQWV
jgi:hypothetical protein